MSPRGTIQIARIQTTQIRESVCEQQRARVRDRERALEREGGSARRCGRREREPIFPPTFPLFFPLSCLPRVVSLKYGEFAYTPTSPGAMPDWEAASAALMPCARFISLFNTVCVVGCSRTKCLAPTADPPRSFLLACSP